MVAFDSDPAEVEAVRTGAIDAILVQNPFFFGYQGVVEAAMALQGSTPPVNLDPGAVLVDPSNVGDPALAALLDVTSGAVSQQVDLLRKAGLVTVD